MQFQNKVKLTHCLIYFYKVIFMRIFVSNNNLSVRIDTKNVGKSH